MDLQHVLSHLCQNGPEEDYIYLGNWEIVHIGDDMVIDKDLFAKTVKAEMRFDISIIVQSRNASSRTCPQCGRHSSKKCPSGWICCLSCGNQFRVVSTSATERSNSGGSNTSRPPHITAIPSRFDPSQTSNDSEAAGRERSQCSSSRPCRQPINWTARFRRISQLRNGPDPDDVSELWDNPNPDDISELRGNTDPDDVSELRGNTDPWDTSHNLDIFIKAETIFDRLRSHGADAEQWYSALEMLWVEDQHPSWSLRLETLFRMREVYAKEFDFRESTCAAAELSFTSDGIPEAVDFVTVTLGEPFVWLDLDGKRNDANASSYEPFGSLSSIPPSIWYKNQTQLSPLSSSCYR
ncbi:hypothetical protein AB1N83_012858 [Pleurotus pulmonarius]